MLLIRWLVITTLSVTPTFAQRTYADFYRHLRELRVAMMTRVVTDEEFKDAVNAGIDLVVGNESYREDAKRRELNDLFYQQARLRALAACSNVK